jgi:hypothetical protein
LGDDRGQEGDVTCCFGDGWLSRFIGRDIGAPGEDDVREGRSALGGSVSSTFSLVEGREGCTGKGWLDYLCLALAWDDQSWIRFGLGDKE